MTRIIRVCLGAKFLTNAAVGDIEIQKYGSPPKLLPEIVWSQVIFNQSNNDLNKIIETPFHVLHLHGDRILLHKNAELIACSKRYKEQFFKIGNLAYGLKFHIELSK